MHRVPRACGGDGPRTADGGCARRRADGVDTGQVSLLVLGYTVLALVLVLVVVSASSVHLERKRLLALADGAATDAADAVDVETYFGGDGTTAGIGERAGVPLTDATVRGSVEEHLQRSGAGSRFVGLTVLPGTGTPDGRTAEVRLAAEVPLPVVGEALGWSTGGVRLEVTSRARTLTASAEGTAG